MLTHRKRKAGGIFSHHNETLHNVTFELELTVDEGLNHQFKNE